MIQSKKYIYGKSTSAMISFLSDLKSVSINRVECKNTDKKQQENKCIV